MKLLLQREEEWFGRRSDCEMAVLESDIGSQDAVVIQTSAEYSYTQLFRKLHCHILQVQGQGRLFANVHVRDYIH